MKIVPLPKSLELDSASNAGLGRFLAGMQEEKKNVDFEAMDAQDVFEFLMDTPLLDCLHDPPTRTQYLVELNQVPNSATTVSECLSAFQPNPAYLNEITHRMGEMMRWKQSKAHVQEAAAVIYYLVKGRGNPNNASRQRQETLIDLSEGLEWAGSLSWLSKEYRSMIVVARLELKARSKD